MIRLDAALGSWVIAVKDCGALAFHWPCGAMHHTRANGNALRGVLVIVYTPGQPLQLAVKPPGFRVEVTDHPPAPVLPLQVHPELMQWPVGPRLEVVLQVAAAIVRGARLTIGYPDSRAGGAIKERRLDMVVPNTNGRGITCTDLDKDAVRAFRLEKIVTAKAEELL